MKCEKCNTENGYPKFTEMIWQCKKCLHKTKIPKEEKEENKQ